MKPTQELLSFVAGRIGEQPGITEAEIRRRLNNYINGMLMPALTHADFLRMIEANPAVTNQRRRATKYSRVEIDRRSALSDGVREGMIEYAIWPTRLEKTYLSNGANVTREGRALFYYEAPGQTDPRNREILWLVDQNPDNRPAYIAEKKRQLIADGMTEQQAQEGADAYFTDDAMRKRRSELVLSRVAECVEIAQKVGELTAEERTPAELGANYLAIMHALDIANDLGVYIGQATNGRDRMEFTEEQLEYLEQRKADEVTLRDAVIPLASMGNPCYAFLDPDDIMDSNIDDLINTDGIITQEQKEQNMREDPNFEVFTRGQGDLFQSYATDVRGLRGIRRSHADAREQRRMQEVYGFTPEDTVQVSESNQGYTMLRTTETAIEKGKPVAYEMGNRTVILTATGTYANPTVSAEHPEALFNHTLTQKSNEVYELLAATDVKYKISSPEYREMKRALDRARSVRPLGQDGNVDKRQELENARKRFETLLANTNAYLKKKPQRSEKKYENDRIQAANQVREYAEMKLRQLELVEKARDTLERYKGMAEDEIRRVTAIENAEIARIKEQDARREDPVSWLGNLSDRYYAQSLPTVFVSSFSSVIQDLHASPRDENGVFANDRDGSLALDAKLIAGYSVAGELILRERAQRAENGLAGNGPLEIALFGGRAQRMKDWIRILGEQVIETGVGMSVDGLNREELTHFLASFDPKAMADRVSDAFSKRCGAAYINAVEERYGNVGPTVRQFVDKSILANAKEYQRQALEKTLNVPHNDVARTVSNHVLANLAQKEGQTGEKLRQLMQHQKNVDVLLTYIQGEGYVENLTASLDKGGNTTEIDVIRRMTGTSDVIANHIAELEQFAQAVETMFTAQKQAQAKSDEFVDAVASQYGKAPFTEAPLSEFVNSSIIAPAQTYKAQMEAMETSTEFATGYRMMSSCVLAQLVQLEKNSDVLHQMMKSQDGIDAMLGLLQASDPFKQMIAEFDRMGEKPDIHEIPRLIQSKQPQRAALAILKDAKFKQMLDGVVTERKPVAEHSGPQMGNAQPQAVGHH